MVLIPCDNLAQLSIDWCDSISRRKLPLQIGVHLVGIFVFYRRSQEEVAGEIAAGEEAADNILLALEPDETIPKLVPLETVVAEAAAPETVSLNFVGRSHGGRRRRVTDRNINIG